VNTPVKSELLKNDPDEVDIPGPRIRPRDAATLILVKRDGGEPQVLMGMRAAGMAFMPNRYVFPGGRVDPGDQRIVPASDLKPHVLQKLTLGTTASRARGLALAAIRETFEETGNLVGEHSEKTPRTRSAAWRQFFAHGIVPRLDGLDYIARAITPPQRPRRFDARFLMADASVITHTLDATENEELLQSRWLTFSEARALDIPAITRTILEEVEARTRAPNAPRPIPFFRFSRNRPSLTHL
jgi:8-oxo-dGTP pyrophosphatase MutT (NUDIX family)